jgi:hypothetical protein
VRLRIGAVYRPLVGSLILPSCHTLPFTARQLFSVMCRFNYTVRETSRVSAVFSLYSQEYLTERGYSLVALQLGGGVRG